MIEVVKGNEAIPIISVTLLGSPFNIELYSVKLFTKKNIDMNIYIPQINHSEIFIENKM